MEKLIVFMIGAPIALIVGLSGYAIYFHATHTCVRSHEVTGMQCIMHNLGTKEVPVWMQQRSEVTDTICDEWGKG